MMRELKNHIIFIAVYLAFFPSCDKVKQTDDCVKVDIFCDHSIRKFDMGFSSWAYAPSKDAIDSTYLFIKNNSTIYSEHIDNKIPWQAWMNDQPLPTNFTNDIAARVYRKLPNTKLTLSVSLFNSSRNELASDFDGSIPQYSALNDTKIENAYFKHLQYLTNQLKPDYLIIAIEVNELLKNAPEKWKAYKLLMANIRTRLKQEFPDLSISESITLHNLYEPDVSNPEEYINELVQYANTMEFVSISFYPFFKGFSTKTDFQRAFDFLHTKITQPIAFAETGHLSEDLTIDTYDLFIPGSQSEQNNYLEILLTNAQQQNYKYIIWWTHRDYYNLWETFPDEVKDLGKLWISTGLINEDGTEKEAYYTWESVFLKP